MGDQSARRQIVPGTSEPSKSAGISAQDDADSTRGGIFRPNPMNAEAGVPFGSQIPPAQMLQHMQMQYPRYQSPTAYLGGVPMPMTPHNYTGYSHGAFDMGQIAGALPHFNVQVPHPPAPAFPQAQHNVYHRLPERQQANRPPHAHQVFTPQYANYQQPHVWNPGVPRGGAARSSNPRGRRSSESYLVTQTDVSAPSPVTSHGPPRKPRQSGHALWVGNLPPNATVTDLKDHFSREATNDIESLKLISKSNCAFVNYRTAESCQAAMERFHDSRFHGARVVCRLRRASNVTTTVEADGAEDVQNASTQPGTPISPVITQNDEYESQGAQSTEGGEEERAALPERYFVLKSLTLRDLDLSTRNGIWATQAHNENSLNEAYKSADNVYLIFSANKSGEYFGYARMASEIPAPGLVGESSVTDELNSLLSSGYTVAGDQGPKILTTPATEWAPKGRIIDDSARGTIFWEADRDDEKQPAWVENKASRPQSSSKTFDGPVIASSDSPSGTQSGDTDLEDPQQATERYFRVEWKSTRKVPFYKTRGLRNPWNSNREVKIARDGTEIEPSAAKKLLALFDTVPTSNIPLAN